MNWWNSLCASCAAPEEVETSRGKDGAPRRSHAAQSQQNQRQGGATAAAGHGSSSGSGSGLLSANGKGAGYRDILFHPDGKLRPPFR
jgi:hypothetical protein